MPYSNFTTGSTLLPDTGELTYNGCVFSPLFETKVSGNPIKDNAKRTVKFIEYTIVADGYVTLGEKLANNISSNMATLYRLLTAQGGALTYKGKALDIIVNPQGGNPGGGLHVGPVRPIRPSPNNDVAWGPIPDLLEFQPLGGGLSAKIQWKVTTRLPPPSVASVSNSLGILQLNYETSVTYNEDGYSSLSIKGTTEIPMTRTPSQATRSVPKTADSYRELLERRVLKGIDLGKFRLTKRIFSVSRDKRTLEWDVAAEEKPYMDLPPKCTIAKGSYSVRPAKAGPGLVLWLCTLRATYTVRADASRSTAWWVFLELLRLRMEQSKNTPIPDATDNNSSTKLTLVENIFGGATGSQALIQIKKKIENTATQKKDLSRRAWLIDFSLDEGLYLDSKTISFSATWRLTCNFRDILIASGLWRKVEEGKRTPDKNAWALSMKDVMGSKSWLPNTLDPSLDLIIDFGSTGV